MKMLIALVLILLFPINSYSDCIKKGDSENCISEDLKDVDNSLNKRYQRLIKLLDGNGKDSLKKAQRNWINFRDSACDFEKNHLTEKSWFSEDAKGEMKLNCLTRITKDRLYELNRYVELAIKNTSSLRFDDIINKSFGFISEHDASSQELSEIFDWIDDVALKVKKSTSKDFTALTNNHRKTKIYYLSNSIAASSQNIRLGKDGQPTYVSNGLIIKSGNCNIAHAKNSIIICTGDLHISHASNNIILANGSIDISHDGSQGNGSLILSRENVEVSHSNGSVYVFSKFVKTSHLRNSDCINTGGAKSSHGSCNQIRSKDIRI